MADRLDELHQYVSEFLGTDQYKMEPASSDASFRRYFRVFYQDKTLIAMDAPPEREDNDKFVKICRMFEAFGLNVPIIKDTRLEKGFLIISDLGTEQYLDHLDSDNMESLYGDALTSLLQLQKSTPTLDLPLYDEPMLIREMNIFSEWYLQTHLNITLNQNQKAALDACFGILADNALQQPQVIVHRDYHSRNLLYTKDKNPGILDFQDAVVGAITYDLVSLLRDCYIAWPDEVIQKMVLGYKSKVEQAGLISGIEDETFIRWFDLMGTQRHLKATGIFARLNHRDGKPGYLDDIPRTLNYVRQVASKYSQLGFLSELLNQLPDIGR